VYRQVGSFDYELGVLTNFLYQLGDIGAVIIFKLMLTIIAAIILYYIALNVPKLDNLCKLMCIGASVVGVFAATSNIKGALTGTTLWVFGVRGDMIAYLLFTLFFIVGIADITLKHNGHFPVKKIDDQPQ
jgi:hypothetical protein